MYDALSRFGRIAFFAALIALAPGCNSGDDAGKAEKPKPTSNTGPEMPTPFPQPQPQPQPHPQPDGQRHLEVLPLQDAGFPDFVIRQAGPTIVFSQIERGRSFHFRIRDNGEVLNDLRCPASDVAASPKDRVSLIMPQDPDMTSIQTYCSSSHGNIYIEGTAKTGFSSGVAMPVSPVGSSRWEPVSGQANKEGDLLLAVQGDGSPQIGPRVGFVVAKYHVDGTQDFAFPGRGTVVAGRDHISGSDVPRVLLVDPRDGSYYVLVNSVQSEALGNEDFVEAYVLKFTKDGAVHDFFGRKGRIQIDDNAYRIVVKSAFLDQNGRVVIAYNRCTAWNSCHLVIRRLKGNGKWDGHFGDRGRISIVKQPVQSDPKPRIVAGPANSVYYLEDHDDWFWKENFVYITRYTDQGKPDPAFGAGVRNFSAPDVTGVKCGLSDAKVDHAGRLLLLGYCGSSHLALLRLLPDGRHDTSFGANGSSTDLVQTGEFFSVIGGNGTLCEKTNPHGGRISFLENGKFLVVSPTATEPKPDIMGAGCFSAALGIGFFGYDESGKLKRQYRPAGFVRTWREVPYDPAKVTLVTRTRTDEVMAVLGLGGDSYRVVGDPRPATFFVKASLTY